MQRIIPVVVLGASLLGCAVEAPARPDGLTLTTQKPEALIGSYRLGRNQIRFESEARPDRYFLALYSGNGNLLVSVENDGGGVSISLPDGIATASDPRGEKAKIDPNRHPEFALLPWIAHDLGASGISPRTHPSAQALQMLGISLNLVYRVDFAAQTSGDVGQTTSPLCNEFECENPEDIFDSETCDCVNRHELQQIRCGIPGECAPRSGGACDECGPVHAEAIPCGVWTALAVLTPGVFDLFTALQAGQWGAAGVALASVGSQTAFQELGALPGVSSCICIATAALEGCSRNLCSVFEYVRGERTSFCGQ